MARLQEVLQEASAREAYELVMESGQPVVLTTPQGPEALGGVLGEGELIDALAHVLNDEQQVELAVGNLIEFQLETDSGRWTLVTEPVSEGVLVRGRLQGAPGASAPARAGALDLPPLDPFSPPATGEPLAAPGAGADKGRARRPTMEEPPVDFGIPAPEPARRHGSSELEMDVSVDLDGRATGDTLASGPGASPPAADSTASGARPEVQASFDDLGFGAPVSSAGGKSDSTLFSAAGGPAPVPNMGAAEPLDTSSAADLGFGAPDPAEPQGRHDATLHMGSDSPRLDDKSLGIPADDDDSSFADLNLVLEPDTQSFTPPPSEPIDPAAVETQNAPTAPSTPTPAPGSAAEGLAAFAASVAPPTPPSGAFAPPVAPSTPTPAPGFAAEGLAALAGSIEPGTLCFVHGHGVAEQLAGHIGVPFVAVDDGPDGTSAMQSLLEGHAGPGTVIVRMEDPSAQLGFLLRRLEEGWRVLVETRARTAEGARRTLLGVGATAVAEAWLDAQVTSWAMLEAGHWKLL